MDQRSSRLGIRDYTFRETKEKGPQRRLGPGKASGEQLRPELFHSILALRGGRL